MDLDSATILAQAGIAIRAKGWGTEHRLVFRDGKSVKKVSESICVDLTPQDRGATYFVCDERGVSLELEPKVSMAESQYLNAVRSTHTTQMKAEEKR